MNFACEAGRCVAPPARDISVHMACVTTPSCLSSARAPASEEPATSGAAACLVLEQPHHLSAHTLYLSADGEGGEALLSPEASVRVALFEAPLRASLSLLAPGASCPSSVEEIRASGLAALCLEAQGCRLRLRRPELTREEVGAAGAALSVSFDQEGGQCFESAWPAAAPAERCDGADNDCDGFADEGLSCPTTTR